MNKNNLQKTIINLIFKGLVVFSILVIIDKIAGIVFDYFYSNAKTKPEVMLRQFEKENRQMLSQDTNIVWLNSYAGNQNIVSNQSAISGHANTNTEGFRVTPLPYKLNNFANKIMFFGNSTLWGAGFPDSLTIPAIFGTKLSSIDTLPLKKRYPIIQNLAIRGAVSTQMLVQLELELEKGSIPDVVIVLNGATDISQTLGRGTIVEYQNYKKQIKMVDSTTLDINLITQNIGQILKKNNIYKLIRKIMNPYQPFPYRVKEKDYKNIAKRVVENYFENYFILEKLAKKHHFKLMVCWQPISLKRAEELQPKDIFSRKFILAVNEELIKKIDKNNYPCFYNMSNSLQDKKGKLFLDYCHITTLGNEYVAQEILKNYLSFN